MYSLITPPPPSSMGMYPLKEGRTGRAEADTQKKLYPAETAAFLEYPELLNTVSFFFFCYCVQSLCRIVSLKKKKKKNLCA